MCVHQAVYGVNSCYRALPSHSPLDTKWVSGCCDIGLLVLDTLTLESLVSRLSLRIIVIPLTLTLYSVLEDPPDAIIQGKFYIGSRKVRAPSHAPSPFRKRCGASPVIHLHRENGCTLASGESINE